MSNITITRTEKTISVQSPYNSLFVSQARRLGGKWKTNRWVFDIRNESSVLNALYRFYGDDGVRKNQCDVRISIEDGYGEHHAPIIFFGCQVARAFGRDSGAKISDGVVIESGGFTSGGSFKNWTTRVLDNTNIILRDISRILVDEHDDDDIKIEILETSKPYSTKELIVEKELLEKRLAEINGLLEVA